MKRISLILILAAFCAVSIDVQAQSKESTSEKESKEVKQ